MQQELRIGIGVQDWKVGGLVMLGVVGFYLLVLDQGLALSLVQGTKAFEMNLLHEVLHDARHVAAFPCH